jgi:hypothetical protein
MLFRTLMLREGGENLKNGWNHSEERGRMLQRMPVLWLSTETGVFKEQVGQRIWDSQ